MIFDFYLYYDFNFKEKDVENFISFKQEKLYRKIKGDERLIKFPGGYAVSLYRNKFEESFFDTSKIKMWIFGEVFSSKKYALQFGKKPFQLSVKEIYKIFKDSGIDGLKKYIKGSYVIILYNCEKEAIEIITDRLNVLPLYYSFSKSKLIVSSNTALIYKSDWVDKSIDNVALAMQFLFDYMLGDYYFFKGIRRCKTASFYQFSKDNVQVDTYWDVKELYHETLLPQKQSLDLLANQLHENVKLYSSDKEKLLVSLTGGFDGRTNLALLKERDKSSYITYSYGMPGSKQIEVPKKISQKLGVQYKPVYLEKDFIDKYYENTIKASYFSNGSAPIGFSNIPYAYDKLNNYSDTILTGLLGSEILRPLHNTGIQVNESSFNIFLSKCFKESIKNILLNSALKGLLQKDELLRVIEDLSEYFENNYFNKYDTFDKVTVFFFFILTEGLLKYFSQEISIERVYVTTRIPYFDIDMIDLIYQTPWAGMYNGFLGKSKFKRRKGQLLYAHSIKKYWAELGDIILDRGYKPNDLLLPFPLNYLKIAMGVFNAKKYMKKHNGNDTFKTEIWSKETIETILKRDSEIKNLISKDYNNTNSKKYTYLTYRHLVSIHLFLNMLSSNSDYE